MTGEAGGQATARSSYRRVARQLVAEVAARQADLLLHDGIDLAPALEQALFGRLRRPRPPERLPGPRSVLRTLRHGAGALLPSEAPAPGDVVALVVNPAQGRILEPVRGELERRGIRTFTVYESHARAAGGGERGTARLVDHLTPGRTARLLAFDLRARRLLPEATEGFERIVDAATASRMRSALAEAIGHAALYATCMNELAAHRPSLLVGFNEIGRWSRILPSVGRRSGIPTLDVAHAEAVDADAIEGAAYDRFAVFGPRSQRVLERAGIDPDAIVAVGAPRFDALIARYRQSPRPPEPRRLVFASQWLGGAMTEAVKGRTVRAAMAAAAAVAPCELVIQPHPIERDGIAPRIAATEPIEGVRVRVGEPGGLHGALDGAWLLLTGWSNAVFEALLSNVPALSINATGEAAPMPFAEEGIALGAVDDATAAEAARSLVAEPAWRAAVARGRAGLGNHLGPLDGRATERLAELIVAMRGAGESPAPSPSGR